jgi:hypothetical protein
VTIETVVLDHLLASPPVAAIIGTRGYQLVLPQSPTLPAMRVQLIDEIETYVLIGLTNCFRARIQVDIWTDAEAAGDPYEEARAGSTAIRDALAVTAHGGQRFMDGSPTVLEVTSVQTLDKTVDYEADELRRIRVRQDFAVVYREVSLIARASSWRVH